MRARREVTISVICALLVACSAAASAPDESHDPTIEGVGILPGSNADVLSTDANSSAPLATVSTTTLTPQPAIGTVVTGNRLLMIGDSITASAAQRYGGEFCKALVPLGWQVEVDAEPSRFVDFGNTVLDKRLSAKWDAVYVFLGSNYLGDQESYRRQLERIVQRLSPSPVVLLTVTEFEDNRREVNDAITLVSAEFPNVHLLDWGAIASANADQILRGDGLHLTNDGRAVLASTIAGVMGQAPQPEGDCLSTSFHNDSGLSVNGTDTPPKKKVGPTQTTVKSPTATTKPPATVPPSPTTVAPTIPAPTTPPPTQATVPSPRRTIPPGSTPTT
jgi:lysophospholipase L1-like esterase